MNRIQTILATVTLSFHVLTCTSLSAGPGITYQGEIKQAGQAIDGTADVTFGLFAAADGGTPLGSTQAFGALDIIDGKFTVVLNDADQFGADAFGGEARWLEITVDGVTLAPRQPIMAAPLAHFALNAPFRTNGSTVYYNEGNVGLGTASPVARLDIRANSTGIYARSDSSFAFATGITGILANDFAGQYAAGVKGEAYSDNGDAAGVAGLHHGSGKGVHGSSISGIGVYGETDNNVVGYAGYFKGGRNYFEGSVGIGVTAPLYKLHVNGSAGKPGGGSWSNSSDVRLKKNIEPLRDALERLLAVEGVTFEYIDPRATNELSGTQIGVIAQQLEEVFPQWVDEGADGYKRVTYRGFEAVSIEAMRELRDENAALRARLVELEQKVDALLADDCR